MGGDTSTGWTNLHYAAAHGESDRDGIRRALAAGCALEAKTSDGQTALHKAVKFGSEHAVKALISAGANLEAVDENTQTPLHLAACYDTVAEPLLKAGANKEALDYWKWTPVFWATYRDYDRIFIHLRDHGARTLDIKDDKGMTLLHWTGRSGSPKICRLLLDSCRTIHIEARDTWNWTPILWAAYHDKGDVVEMLADFDANKNVTDSDGMTPLMWAAKAGQVNGVKALLKRHAKKDLRDHQGKTARDWASTSEIKKLLE